MNYRRTQILAEKSITSPGTETIDIHVRTPISRITLAWRVTKALNYNTAHPAADITKIELVDGSDVLFNLSGYMNQALCIYDRKCPTMNYGQHILASYEYSTYGIDFGRHLWDKVLALDPTKFTNLQLKITHNLALADTSATQAYMEAIAECFDEKVISPIGFLMSKEVKSFTPGADGSFDYTRLPTDYPYRQLLIRAFEIKYDPHETIEAMKLDEDNDARIPIEMDLEDFNRINKGVNPMVIEPVCGYIGGGTIGVFYITPTDMVCVLAGEGHGAAGCKTGVTTYPRGGYVDVRSDDTNAYQGMAMGWLPNHTMRIPFGLQDEIEDWYDVTKVGELRLRLESGARGASGTCQVAIQQLRKY